MVGQFSNYSHPHIGSMALTSGMNSKVCAELQMLQNSDSVFGIAEFTSRGSGI